MATDAEAAELDSVILLRTHDPVRARMARALLEREDIPVATPGLQHASLLPYSPAIEICVRVPARDAERARALVKEMEREVEEEPIPSENAPYREAAKKRPAAPLSPRLKRIAVVASFIVPGGAHFYVQRSWLALAVIAGYAAAIASMFAWVPYSGYALVVVWLGDVLGGLDGCDVAQGRAGSGWRRHASIGALGLVGGWAFLALGPLLGLLAGSTSATMCDWEARCATWRSEQQCLLDSIGATRAEPAPSCVACVRREHECHAIESECASLCWPEDEGSSGLAIDPLLLGY